MAQNEMKAKPALPERVRSMEGLGGSCHGADKLGFGIGVSLSVFGVRFSELVLKRSIADCKLRLLTQSVAEAHSLAPRFCAMNNYVKMVCAVPIGPTHEPLAITKSFVEFDGRCLARPAQWFRECFGYGHGLDSGQDVNDRLRH